MCTAENIYYTTCGCFSGHHITWLCPRSTITPGAGTICPAIDAQGVLRRPGKCLPCRRRDWQQQVLERLLPLPDAPPSVDSVSDRLTLLSAMIRRAVENSNANSNGKTEGEKGKDGQGKDEPGVVAEESTRDEVQQEVVETDSTAWHQG
ncbi:hypothetical protein CKAH01_02389 [Colletotrichum kahawae]|uniref:Uncharacterized protein n=1 Tax=Colletotrichum kahawae TaxID=34407 RepID=A0AAE0CYS5_COLKA|nr:hypothetical protein CKAH01_02389 [Colletotrichum kahawae]